MVDFILRTYRYFRRHRAVCWLSMTGLFLLMGWLSSRVHLEEDITSLMPSSRNEDGSTKLAFADLKIKDKTFVLFERTGGATVEEVVAACDAFAEAIGQDSTLVDDIFSEVPEDLLFDAADYLAAHLPAYLDTTAYAHLDTMLLPAAMQRQMVQNRRDLESPLGQLLPELIEQDPIGLRHLLAGQCAPLLQGGTGSYRVVGGHFFVPDSTVCVAFLTPRFSATNTGDGTALFERIDAQIARLATQYPDVHISYHGTPAHGYNNARQIKHDLVATVGAALLLVVLLVIGCFRRWDSVPLLVLPVAFGTLVGLAAMTLIRGNFSLMALGIGAVVLGVAFSYVLHVLTHHAQVGDPEQVLRDETAPICLGCLTTIGSFCGLLFVKTDLLRDFGLFATFAILGTCFFTLVYLPQMLGSGAERRRGHFRWADRIHAASLDGRRPVVAGVLVLAVACCIFCLVGGGAQFDSDMHHLGYASPQVAHSEQLLRSKTDTTTRQRYFASTGRTMEEAIGHFVLLSHKLDSLQAAGLVKSYTRTNQLFVPLAVQQERIEAWHAFWTDERLQQLHAAINVTAPAAGLLPEAFDSFFIMAEADHQPDALYRAGIIPRGYLSTLMEQSLNGQYLCFTAVRSSEADYLRVCDAVADNPNLLVLDTYYYTQDTLRQMNRDFNLLQWLSMLFVLLVLLLSYRFNLRHTLLAFMPILLSWFIVLGMMNIFGVRFNLISIVVSTFVFGIGVDYSIFVMSGLLQRERGGDLLASHKTAVLLSALILVVSIGSMLLATHPAIHSVGFTTLVGIVSAVVLAYVVQPAIYKKVKK